MSHPDRPLIRISSTFFYHLSSDYDLVPIPPLAARAKILNAGEEDKQQDYPSMKVGQQVLKWVFYFKRFLNLTIFASVSYRTLH